MKKILLHLTLIISFTSCGQKVEDRIEETITDANGKVISKEISNPKKTNKQTPENVVELFYKNQDNISVIDPLMSFRFYQQTSYNRFKELLAEKCKAFGEFVEKSLIKSEKSDDGKAISLTYKVKYKNVQTEENIGLIKETENGEYQIYIYNVKRSQ